MNRLRAAAGAVELRPVVGAPLTGFAARLEPSVGIHDPLLARLLLLDDGSTRLLWIACDVIGFDPEDDADLRRLAASELSLPADNVLVSCTHTHSGPASMAFRGPLGGIDRAWLARTFDSIAEASRQLAPRLRPARLAHATQTVTGLGYNRQDGTSPIDERVLIAQFTDDDDDGGDGRVIATLLNYATHPVVLGHRNLLFSADYPGYAVRLLEQATGAVALFVQGSAGDVNPAVFRDAGREAGTFDVAEEMGRALATVVTRALAGATKLAGARLAVARERVELPLEPPPSSAQLAQLKRQLESRRGPSGSVPTTVDGRFAVFELAWAEELGRAIERDAVPRTLRVQLSAARVGDVLVVTFPLEVYSQIGLDVRRALAPHPVIIAGYTNGLFGYAPTDLAIQQGGYGPGLSYRFFPRLLTPLARGTASALVEAATTLLARLASPVPSPGTPGEG